MRDNRTKNCTHAFFFVLLRRIFVSSNMNRMRRNILIGILCAVCGLSAWAQDSTKVAKRQAVKSHLQQHFKPYGFIRNYFTYDSRESMSGTGDLYNYQPYDESWNQTNDPALREDLNATSTFRFLSLTTRVGVDIVGYTWRNTEFGAKIEADFYAALSGTGHKLNGDAQFRLRQAYLTLGWDSLKMGKDYARVDLLLGQAWHPMAADLSDVLSLNSGAPFGPFSRTPQVKMDARLGRYITLTGALLWQMKYTSMGPNGSSAEYIMYSKTPEAYLGLSVHDKGFLMRAGANVLSICPRHIGSMLDDNLNTVLGTDGLPLLVKVSDRITTVSPFIYLQYKKGEFSIKAKSILAEAGEHMNMNGGYGVHAIHSGGGYSYTPTRTSSTWLSIVYGGKVGAQEDKHPQKLQGILFAGYIRNFGTKESLYDPNNDGVIDAGEITQYYYYPRVPNMNRMWRLTPTLLYTVGRFQIGLEYEITSVHYGDLTKGLNAKNGLADSGKHWVTNHRVQLITKFNF